MSPNDCRLYLLFTPELCARDPWGTLAAALAGGADLVQWRVATEDRGGFDRCREMCRNAGVPLIVNDDVMLAVRGRAQGAHVGQTDMAADAARKLLADKWLGVSTHSPEQIAAAAAAGADYVGYGPCHPTSTKGYTESKPPADLEAAIAAAAARHLPLFAIGGITPDNLPALRATGIDRIAVCGSILGSDDPLRTTRALRRWL